MLPVLIPVASPDAGVEIDVAVHFVPVVLMTILLWDDVEVGSISAYYISCTNHLD